MINKLTGESVSKETLETIERLMRGENVNMETIDNLKEIKDGYSHLSQGDSTHLLKNREKIQNEVLNRLQNQGSAVTKSDGTVSFNGYIICEKRLDIVIGLPAAGKSSALANPISELCQSRIIDNDDAKKELPEYDNGWGAGVVHEESQQISQMQFDKSLNKGENIVYPKVGGNLKKLTATIRDKELQELMSYDELELDIIGDNAKDDKTALFITFPTSWSDMKLITAMLYTQIFRVLNDRANDVFGGELPIPVHFLLDDFSFIGRIPNFDKIIATLKGRNIWVSIIVQSISKIKRLYGKHYEEIIRNCDNMLYLGAMDNETQEFIHKYLNIKNRTDLRTGSVCLVARNRAYRFCSQYDITKHKLYRHLVNKARRI